MHGGLRTERLAVQRPFLVPPVVGVLVAFLAIAFAADHHELHEHQGSRRPILVGGFSDEKPADDPAQAAADSVSFLFFQKWIFSQL